MKYAHVLTILVMSLVAVTCEFNDEETQSDETTTVENHQNEKQLQKVQESLFNILEHLGNSRSLNRTKTANKTGKHYWNIIKSLSFNIHLNNNKTEENADGNLDSSSNVAAKNSELLERLTKLEKDVAALQQNQKSVNDVLNSNDLVNNNSKQLPENALDPCETARTSGVFKIQQLNQNVYCEMDTFGGGWLVIQQRVRKEDGFRLNFDRYWTEFQAGFGTVEKDGEFWLGLETLHQITHSGEYELAVEFRDSNGTYGYARYSKFRVGVAYDKYRLTVDGYLGTLGDGLSRQNNSRFTTFDSDNDTWKENCAKNFANGGWWYSDCGSAPNYSGGPWWDNFSNNVIYKNYGTYVRMMIRQNKCSVSLN